MAMNRHFKLSCGGASARLECIIRHVSSTSGRQSDISLAEPKVSYHPRSMAQGTPFPPITPGVLRLYNMRFCPFAQRTKLVLEHKNIPHETINVNLKYKPDWFLNLAPLTKVPVLQLDDMVLPESVATCEWLDDAFVGTCRLTPQDPLRRAFDRVLLDNVGSISDTFYAIRRNEDIRDRKLASLEKKLKWFDNILAQRGSKYFGGSEPAMVDLLIWPHFERLPALATLASYPQIIPDNSRMPHLAAWIKTMYALPAVKATMMDDNKHAHFFISLRAGAPDYDFDLET